VREGVRQAVVLEEHPLEERGAGQVLGHPRGEEAVAQPAGALPGRAIHEDIDGVLAERI
jgi:hypothetical protein